jgi:hypothetical protein
MFSIAIPSYNRFSILIKKTLPLLLSQTFNPSDIHVFVVEEQEEQYKTAIHSMNANIKVIVGKHTLSAQRNFIIDYFPIGTHILFIDDDVSAIGRKNEDKIELVYNLPELVEQWFELCEKRGVQLWGLYPVWNGYYMKNNWSRGLHYVLGNFYGQINSHRFKCQYEHGEDYARSLKEFYENPNGIIRFNAYAAKSRGFTGKGGMNSPEFNRIANVLPSLLRLQQEYPNNVIIKMKRTPIEVYNVKLIGRKMYEVVSP